MRAVVFNKDHDLAGWGRTHRLLTAVGFSNICRVRSHREVSPVITGAEENILLLASDSPFLEYINQVPVIMSGHKTGVVRLDMSAVSLPDKIPLLCTAAVLAPDMVDLWENTETDYPGVFPEYDLSVIIPARKASEYIEECLDSVCAQKPGEIIVGVDNCPETLNKLESIKYKYPGLRIFRSETSAGPYLIRNTLAKLSRGGSLMFFDADDIMKPGLLKHVSHKLETKDVVRFCFDKFSNTDLSDSKYGGYYSYGQFGITRDAFNRAGGFLPWKCHADAEFRKRVKGFLQTDYTQFSLFYKREHGDALTINQDTAMGSDLRNEYNKLIKSKYDTFYIEPEYAELVEVKHNHKTLSESIFLEYEDNNNSKISVVMPAFKTEEFIEDALDSVYAQKPGEILVGVDNCPDTLAKLVSIKHKYPSLRVFMSGDNRGPFVMRNTMAYLSKGDIIVFFDTDDIMKPGMLKKIRSEFSDGSDIIRYRLTQFKHGTDCAGGKDSDWYACGSTGMTRSAFMRAGGFKDWRCAADREMVMRCSGFMKIKCLPERLYWYRTHDHNLTRTAATGMGSALRDSYHKQITDKHQDCFIEPVTASVSEIKEQINPVVSANMSTYPGGECFLAASLESIIPHVDIVRVYLNGYSNRAVPECLNHPKIVYMRGPDRKSAGRLCWAGKKKNEIFFTVDDDIIYSAEYFRKHIEYLSINPEEVVSCHGRVVHNKKDNPYLKENWSKVGLFYKGSAEGFFADVVGVGVMAFNLNNIQFDLNEFPFYDITDATVSAMCRDRGVRIYIRPHEEKELRHPDRKDCYSRSTLWSRLQERLPRIDRVWQKDWSRTDD